MKPLKKNCLLLIFPLFLLYLSCASNKTPETPKIVTGFVYDDYGPIAGKSVTSMRTFRGVQTDYDGKFEIEVLEGDVLEIGYPMHKIQKIKITKQTHYRIKLEETEIILD